MKSWKTIRCSASHAVDKPLQNWPKSSLERFPIRLTMKSDRPWPGSALDSTLVAFPFGKPVSTFPGNALRFQCPLRLDIDRIDRGASAHEQAVALLAAEAQVGAGLRQVDPS